MSTINRIGFCCMWLDHPEQMGGFKRQDEAKQYNTKTTTLTWMNRQSTAIAEERLWDIMKHNLESVRMLVKRVGTLPPALRMLRVSSDLLPLYTEPTWAYFWRQSDVVAYLERHFAAIGETARRHDVRLSFHPGQFTCIVSENEGIVINSLAELEYHATMARMMGYGQSKLDFKINVHLSGKRGVSGFDSAWNRMSPELRNMLTLENDEFQAGLDELLPLRDRIGIVLDVHHHWIRTGEYIESHDPRIPLILESWGDRRPVVHYSQTHEDLLPNHPVDQQPDMSKLLVEGHKKTALRTHSNFMHNVETNKWMRQHWDWADICVEAKAKNLASQKLYEYWNTLG